MSLTGHLKYGTARTRSNAVCGSAAADLPIPLKGNHSAVLHDTGTGYAILPGQTGDWMLPVVETCELVTRRHKYVRLQRSVLVRMKVRRNGDEVEVLSGSDEIGRQGLIVTMPCTLDFQAGVSCDMELFLTQDREPLPVRGTVRRITRAVGEDSIRYKMEIEFGKLDAAALKELGAFVDSAKPRDLRPILA